MAITIQCPNPGCRATASVAEAVGGRPVKCKRCGTPFVARPTLDGRPQETQGTPPPGPARDPFPTLPAEFGRYRVLKLLGKGGMGAVYLAEDSQLGRRVALKLPAFGAGESAERVERFLREARSAAALHHPNICTLYDAGRQDGRPYLTMAYVEGRSLAEEIDPDRPMPQRQAAELVRKVAVALGHAHDKGIVHRDLKPANVMLTAAGEPVVTDFGLAKRVADPDPNEAKLTRVGAVLGTPAYMAPEQVRGETDRIGPPTDVYALGVMLFELLTGQPPYQGPAAAVMGQILAAPVPPAREYRADVDERLEAVCRRAMAKEPGERYASMASFSAALDDYLKGAPLPEHAAVRPTEAPRNADPFGDLGVADSPRPAGKRPRPRRARGPLFIAAGLVVLLGAVFAVVLALRDKPGDAVVAQGDQSTKGEGKSATRREPENTPPSNKEPVPGSAKDADINFARPDSTSDGKEPDPAPDPVKPPDSAPDPVKPEAPKPFPRGRWVELDPATGASWAWGPTLRNSKSLTQSHGELALDNGAMDFPKVQAADVSLRARVKYLEGQNVGLAVRCIKTTQYYAYCPKEPDGKFAFALGVNTEKGFRELKRVRRANVYKDFFELRVTISGDLLTVHANGEKMIELKDDTVRGRGKVGLNAFHARGLFKEIEVKVSDK